MEHVTPREAWEALLADPNAQLVDVRTDAEWQRVGLPDLAAAGKRAVLVSWQFPTGSINPDFASQLSQAGLQPGHSLYFLCRSGVRSESAALEAEALGYAACFNVAEGFEGAPDGRGQRGAVNGWKARGLPWTP